MDNRYLTATEIRNSRWYRESRQAIDRLSQTFEQQVLQPLIDRTLALLKKRGITPNSSSNKDLGGALKKAKTPKAAGMAKVIMSTDIFINFTDVKII